VVNNDNATLLGIEIFLRERGDFYTALAIDAVIIDEGISDSESGMMVSNLLQEAMKNAA
jgi:hypothetical protein